MRKRIRFGVKMPIFVNMATFVFYLNHEQADRMADHVSNILVLLRLAGQNQVADRIVFDVS